MVGQPFPGPKKRASKEDPIIGKRITALRRGKGLTQTALGRTVGVTFQQIQKYESGQSRVSAPRMSAIAKVLGVSLAYLYSEGSKTNDESSNSLLYLLHPGALEIVKAYAQIHDPQLRQEILALVRSAERLAEKSGSDAE